MQQPQWAQPHPNASAPDPARAGQADAGQQGTTYSQWGGPAATGGGILPTISHSSYATTSHVDVPGRHGLAPADASVSYPAQQAAWQQQLLQQQQQQQPQSRGQYSQGSMGPPATMLQHQQLPPIPQLQSTLKPQPMPVLGQQLTETSGSFGRHFAQDLTAFSRPATADMQALGAAGLAGQHMSDAAAGGSFTGFPAGPAAGSVGSAQQWLGGQQQGGQAGQAQLLQSLLASSSSGMSGPASLGGGGLSGTGSNDLLLQAALSGGGVSDEVVRALLLQKLAGQGGLDITTLLLLQNLGKDGAGRGVGQQQGNSNELMMQMLLQQNQAQQQPQAQAQAQAQALAQQQQLLLAAMGQQQQLLGSPPAPPSSAGLAAAGWSGVGGGGSQGSMPPAAQLLQPTLQQQQLLQQVGAQQMAQLQQQQQAAAAAAAAPQLPPAAVSAVNQPPAGTATPATVTPVAPAPTPSAAGQVAEPPSAAGQQKAGSQPPRSPGAQQERTVKQQQSEGQTVLAAKTEPESAAAAPDAEVDRAAMAAMPVADKDGGEADLLMLADTLMSMQGSQQQGNGQHSASKHRRPSSAAADSAAPGGVDAAAAAAAPRPSTPAAAKSPGAAAAAPSPNPGQQSQQEQQQQQQDNNQELEGVQEEDVGMSAADDDMLAAYTQEQQQHATPQPSQLQQQQQQLSMGLQALLQQPDSASMLQYQQQAAALGLQPTLLGLPQALQQPEVPAAPPRRPIEPGFWERVMQDLLFYQEEDNRADDAARAAATGEERAAKRPRAATPEGPLPPDRAALLDGDRLALQQLLNLLQQRQLELGDGFWQKAWHQLQRYLKGDIPEADAAAGLAAAAEVGSKRSLGDATSVEPVPMSQLPAEERSALLQIYDPLKREHIASLQREIARLNAMGAAAGLQAAEDLVGVQDAVGAAAAAAANAMMMQGMPYGFDPTFNWMYGAGGEGDDSGFDAQGQWDPRRVGALRGRGGRPKGSGNRVQMAPRPPGAADTPETGTAKFSLRSVKFTGVYRSRRSQEGWRAQFCYANKVINLGTFATEEEAARVWNEAALLFRGQDAWLNPVEPKLPDDYTPGELHLASDKAASAVIAAAVAAGLQPPKVIVKAT